MDNLPPILDETGLADGMRNLATSYYDTVSQFNRAGEKLKHFSFQKVKGMDWKHAVKTLLGDKHIDDLSERGKKMLGTVMRAGVTGITALADPESGIAGAVVGVLSDFVFDAAESAFEMTPTEILGEGTWVYIDRGRNHNKLKFAEELRAEVAMFGDADEVMARDEERRQYSPGFYISKMQKTDEVIVYAYDVEEAIRVPARDVREADMSDRLRFDQDVAMTEIRELFFMRQHLDNIKYAKFQVGDEVKVGSKKYVCIDADGQTVTLKDEANNIIKVDPQACTAGPRTHWTAQEPDQFRTVAFTLSIGDYAYRPLAPSDVPPTDRAQGVLCVVSYYDGNEVEVRDAWTGLTSTCLPNDLVKPPLQIRKGLNYVLFEVFRKRATKRLNTENVCIRTHYPSGEDLCFAYNLELPFVDTRVLGGHQTQTQATLGGTVLEESTQEQLFDPEERAPKDTMTDGFWWLVGAAGFLILIL